MMMTMMTMMMLLLSCEINQIKWKTFYQFVESRIASGDHVRSAASATALRLTLPRLPRLFTRRTCMRDLNEECVG